MSILNHKTLSRRHAITGVISSLAMLRLSASAVSQVERPAPVDLGHGLEIRDYRLFPTEDVMRFIVEIHNTTDTAVDTPTVAVELPHLDVPENFAWATPVSPVLHPHTSDCLLGVAPMQLVSDSDWGYPRWATCDDLQSEQAQILATWNIDYMHSVEFREAHHAVITINLHNHNNKVPQDVFLQGIVYDVDGRICGSMLPRPLGQARPQEDVSITANLNSTYNYPANPFALIDTVFGVEIHYSLQPRPRPLNAGCQSILPFSYID